MSISYRPDSKTIFSNFKPVVSFEAFSVVDLETYN